jgi:hypothetical protein
MLACEFFTVDTVFATRLYVLFFIELGSRRVQIAGCTQHPSDDWAAQQARELSWSLADRASPPRFLIHDRDSKFTGHRPHRGLGLVPPQPRPALCLAAPADPLRIRRRDRLGGLIHEYSAAA